MANTLSPLTIGDLEMEVLEQLWKLGSGDVKEVHAALTGGRDNHPNTVQSALERLFRKGVLEREKRSHAYLYSPLVTREELAARLIDEALHRVRMAEPMPTLAALVDLAAEQDPGVLDELERLVQAHRAKRTGA
ncbi:MAG: BlaI/MecI/CopY family transcriptional regulator [Holophaga sp.]|nr:BlaI/MecI/CopY family transcriptional regulator [Holophaga sp.]